MPGPPSSDEKYIICFEIPGPLHGVTIEKWRDIVRDAASRLGGKLIEVKLEKKGEGDDAAAR
jgi:hypothetical protein